MNKASKGWTVINDDDSIGAPISPPPFSPEFPSEKVSIFDKAALISEVLTAVRKNIDIDVAGAVDKAQTYAESLRKEAFQAMHEEVAKVEAKLASLQVPRAQVLSVNINGNRAKLTKTAHTALGSVLATLACLPEAKRNVFLFGPVGCGKTTIGSQVAEALNLPFSCTLLTAGASESWITGRLNPKTGEWVMSPFLNRFVNGGVWLWDECTATDPNLALLLNNALDNGFMEAGGVTYTRHKDFVCIAADNTLGLGGNMVFVGRQRLDGSTRERFPRWFSVDYDANIEMQLCPDKPLRDALQGLRDALRKKDAPVSVSTRKIEMAYTMQPLGLSWEELIKEVIGPGWSRELTDLAMTFAPKSPASVAKEAASAALGF